METLPKNISEPLKVEVLRLTAFPADIIKNPEDYQWWLALTGESPENRTQSPRKAILHEEGPFKNGKLILETQPIRFDLVHTAQTFEEPPSNEIPTLGLFSDILQYFNELTNNLFNLQQFPPLRRIAFGAILVNPVKDRKEGYKKLVGFLNFPIDADNSSDFFYQINRPRTINLFSQEIPINRLSKWSVAAYEMLTLQLKPELRSLSPSASLHAIRLELDINTSPNLSVDFDKDKLPTIFKQLIDYGIEISEKGDIA